MRKEVSPEAGIELLERTVARVKAGPPAQQEVDYFLKSFLPSFKPYLRDVFVQESRGAIEEISLLKSALQKELKINRLQLVLDFLMECFDLLDQKFTKSAFQRNDMPQFRFFSDFGEGEKLVMAQIFQAEDKIRGDDGGVFDHAMFLQTKLRDSLGLEGQGVASEVELFLDYRKEAAECAKLLCRDPTGFLLMDTVVSGIKDGTFNIGPVRSRKYVLEGARMARSLYKKAYKIAVPLFPSQTS